VIEFTVFGTPQPAGSKIAFKRGNGSVGVRDACHKSRPWKENVAAAAGPVAMQLDELITGPVALTITFFKAITVRARMRER